MRGLILLWIYSRCCFCQGVQFLNLEGARQLYSAQTSSFLFFPVFFSEPLFLKPLCTRRSTRIVCIVYNYCTDMMFFVPNNIELLFIFIFIFIFIWIESKQKQKKCIYA